MEGFNIWQFLAGIAVFVFAMTLVESSLRNPAGWSFKKFPAAVPEQAENAGVQHEIQSFIT